MFIHPIMAEPKEVKNRIIKRKIIKNKQTPSLQKQCIYYETTDHKRNIVKTSNTKIPAKKKDITTSMFGMTEHDFEYIYFGFGLGF